jgi:ATP-dependent Clp protease adaptor protein ClpS
VTLQQPKKYRVFLLNDDYTPMDFVVLLLKRFFCMTEESATLIMLQVHLQGKGVCGVFTHDIAETKVAWVNEFSRVHQYPLLCCMEPV